MARLLEARLRTVPAAAHAARRAGARALARLRTATAASHVTRGLRRRADAARLRVATRWWRRARLRGMRWQAALVRARHHD